MNSKKGDTYSRTGCLAIRCIQFYQIYAIVALHKIESIRNDKFGWFQVHISSNSCSIQSKYLYYIAQQINLGDKEVYISDSDAIADTKKLSTWYTVVAFINYLEM
jgi:hypothetical protein